MKLRRPYPARILIALISARPPETHQSIAPASAVFFILIGTTAMAATVNTETLSSMSIPTGTIKTTIIKPLSSFIKNELLCDFRSASKNTTDRRNLYFSPTRDKTEKILDTTDKNVQIYAGSALPSFEAITRTYKFAPSGQSTNPMMSFIYNLHFGNGGYIGYNGLSFTMNVTGDDKNSNTGPTGNAYPIAVFLNSSALRSTLSPAGSSQDSNFYSFVHKDAPSGGVPAGRRMRDTWNWWSQTYMANLPTSQAGADINTEKDVHMNGLDDLSTRAMDQLAIDLRVALANGGFAASFNVGRFLTSVNNAGLGIWGHDLDLYGGYFSHAVIDLGYTKSVAPVITSATPVVAVYSVMVDNVMALEGGGSSGGIDFPVSSTAVQTKTASAASGGSTTLTLADTNYLAVGMFVADATSNGIAFGPKITAISGNTVTLSSAVTVASGDTLLFSPGSKLVTINGTRYRVFGILPPAAGSIAGTVYFTTALPVAAATNGVVIYPNTHEIWLCDGSATQPWCDIALDRNGANSLRADGSGGALFTADLTGAQAIRPVGAVKLMGNGTTGAAAVAQACTLNDCNASIGWNYSNQYGEIAFIENVPSVGSIARFYQRISASSIVDVFDILANGSINTTGGFNAKGHNLVAGSTPVLSSCGASPTISGSDNAGLITTGTGATACTLTFATAYAAEPYCTVTGESAAVTYSKTKTAITIAAGAGVKIDYQCVGQAGG